MYFRAIRRTTMKQMRLFVREFSLCIIFLVLNFYGCSSGGGGGSGQPTPTIYLPYLYSSVESITVNVAYEPDAQPYTGTSQGTSGFEYWSLLDLNLESLFASRMNKPEIFVPRELSEMKEIRKIGRKSWTLSQIVGLANDVWDMSETMESAEYYVLFLSGYYNDGKAVQELVIGVSLSDRPIIVIFKDVITDSRHALFDSALMEQGTLVHEFGHCMGLVDLGVPMITDHQDPEHKGHCRDSNCAMNWLYDSSDMIAFSQQFIDTGSVLMYCDDCLADTAVYNP
jgi:hypothetical protein